MIKVRNLVPLLALSSVAVLPACAWFGGSSHTSTPHATTVAAPSQNVAPQAATPELTSDTIRSVQQTLQQDGLYHGRVDGVWGPATQGAVRTYQQQHNMNATGQLDGNTLAAMNLTPASAAAPTQPAPGNNVSPQPAAPNPPNPPTTR